LGVSSGFFSLFAHDFVHADFGSGREPLDDCHFGVHFVGVLGSEFPSPTLSVSVEGGVPAKEDLTMATVVGLVGFHSFFLSFLLIDIIADGLEAVNPCFQIFSKIHSCSTTEQCSPQQGQMP